MIKIGTICSGIGSPEKALKELGIDYELAYFCEFDKFAVQSYCAIHNEPESKNLGDLTKVDIDELPKNLDLIVGGTPCQDFSLAGKRAGGNIDQNTRSSLMWNFVEIIRETYPKIVLWENVPGALSGSMKYNYMKFISTLQELNYTVVSEILNAKNFGIPQNRDRIFVLAIRKDLGIDFKMPVGYDCGIRLKDVLENEVVEKYYISEKMKKYIFESGTKNFYVKPEINLEIARPITTVHDKRAGTTNYISDDYFNGLIELTENQADAFRVYDSNGIARTLKSEAGGGGAKTGLYMYNPYNNAEINDFAPTQTTCCGSTTSSSTVLIAEKQNELRIRKLTPKECYHLMGFSDQDFENAKNSPMSDAQLYKQAGNSIVVNVLMAIFGQLYKVDWKPLVYGSWYKTEVERLEELPLFQLLKS